MKLYFAKGACSLAIRITLNELNLSCDYVSVDLKQKKTETGEDFYKINPKGAVPVLVTHDKQILTEGAAIQQYIADDNKAYEMLPPVGKFTRYQVLEWLTFVSSDMHKALGIFFNGKLADEVKENIFRPLAKNKLAWVNKHLDQRNFLVDNHFTIADSYMFVMLLWLPGLKFDIAKWPELQRYFNQLKERSAIQKALVEEGMG